MGDVVPGFIALVACRHTNRYAFVARETGIAGGNAGNSIARLISEITLRKFGKSGIAQRGINNVSTQTVGNLNPLRPKVFFYKLFRKRTFRHNEIIAGMGGSTYHLTINSHSHRGGYTSTMSTIPIYIVMSWNQVTSTKQLTIFIHKLKIRDGVKAFPTSIQYHNQHSVAIKTQFMQAVTVVKGYLSPSGTIIIQGIED